MRRSLLTIFVVVSLAAWINGLERASGVAAPPRWVRTAEGWQPRGEVDARPATLLPSIHPALIAGFQLSAALFALLAFPAKTSSMTSLLVAVPASPPQRAGSKVIRRRKKRPAPAA